MTRLASLMERGQAVSRKRDSGGQAAGQPIPVPAPFMGMNTRDGITSLNPAEARLIVNMICESGKLVIRKGKAEHQVIPGAASVGSTYTHKGVAADTILAAADGEIWDVTGAPVALTAAAYTLDTWSMRQFNDHTIGVNGTDTPWRFNGSAVVASGLSGSGLTIANLRTVHVVGIRMWFTEEGSADVWYLPVKSITGVLTKFNLSQETKGGYCVGVYEFRNSTVFMMSTGETLTYQGDPATTFSLSGRYDAPKPVGYDPGVAAGGDLILMTESGPLPFEGVAAGVGFDSVSLQSWGKIVPSWTADFTRYGANVGWNALFFAGLVIFNIPTDLTTSKQWVFSTRQKAWSTFEDLDAVQFTERAGVLYYSDRSSGRMVALTGGTDDGAAIIAISRNACIKAWPGYNGQYTLAQIKARATGAVTAQTQVDVDYIERGITAPEIPLASSGSGPWDGPWDGPWGTDGAARKRWTGISGFGESVGVVVQFHSSADVMEFFETIILGARCGPIG